MNAMHTIPGGAICAGQCGTRRRYRPLLLALALALAACSRDDPGALLASAKDYIARNDFNASIIQLKNVLQKDPNNAEARYLLGLSSLKNGDPGAAEVDLEKAIDLGLRTDEVQVALARAELETGKSERVIERFGSKTLSSPKMRAELRALVGMAQLARNLPDEARRSFAEALALDPGSVTANLAMARLAASEKDFREAMARLDKALGAAPSSLEALMLKGDLLAAQGQNEQAESAYREAIRAAPNQVTPRLSLISRLVASGSLHKAGAEVADLAKIAPKDARTFYAKSLLFVADRRYAAAKETILQVLKVAPENVPALMLAGTAAIETGAYAEAENYLRKASYNAPDAVAPRRLLAITYLRMGKTDLAAAQVEQLLTKHGRDANLLTVAGEIALARGDAAGAARDYEQAKSLAPNSAALQTRLAEIRLAAGERDRGISELAAAAASQPHEYQADLALIAVFLREHKADSALVAITNLARKQPDNPLTYNLRGLALVLKKDFAGARASFERALKLQPTYLPAVFNLANLDLGDRNTESAKKRYESVLRMDPYNEQALFRLAVLLRVTGAGRQEIEKLLERAVSGNPGSAKARIALVNFYLTNRDVKGALAAAQDAQAAMPNNPAIVESMGMTQLAAGQPEAAASTFAQLAGMLPESAEPLVRQAQAYVAAKRPDDAIRSLRAALSLQPDQPSVERDIAAIYVSSGRSEEAIREARAMQARQPNQPFGYVLEGEIDVAQKAWKPAVRIYRDAVKKFDLPLLAVRLHAITYASGDGPQADATAESWIKRHPKDVTVLSYLAQRDLAAKRYGHAAQRYQSALERQPDNPVFLNNLAWALHDLRQPKALEYAERAEELAPDNPAIMDTLGWILAESGQTDRGLELLGRASELAPNAHGIRLHLARALIKAGRKSAARKELEALAKLDSRLPVQKEAAALLSGL